MHQLTPELAEDLARAHDALFVDAYRADAIKANVSCARSSQAAGATFRDISATQVRYSRLPRRFMGDTCAPG